MGISRKDFEEIAKERLETLEGELEDAKYRYGKSNQLVEDAVDSNIYLPVYDGWSLSGVVLSLMYYSGLFPLVTVTSEDDSDYLVNQGLKLIKTDSLISGKKEYKVVVFPDPVGPLTNIMPLGFEIILLTIFSSF